MSISLPFLLLPVGNYFKGGLAPTNFLIQDDYDRAAPHGTGAAKVGGNYAASMLPGKIAHDRNFSDVIYLDPATHTKIEESGFCKTSLVSQPITNSLHHSAHLSAIYH